MCSLQVNHPAIEWLISQPPKNGLTGQMVNHPAWTMVGPTSGIFIANNLPGLIFSPVQLCRAAKLYKLNQAVSCWIEKVLVGWTTTPSLGLGGWDAA